MQYNSKTIYRLKKKLSEYLSSINVDFPTINVKQHNTVPPWTTAVQPNIIQSSKMWHHPDIFKKVYRETIYKYKEFQHIYTDGFKNNNKTGAVEISEEIHKFHLPLSTSVFTAEAYSILEASRFIKEANKGPMNFVIQTDPLSTIQSMRQLYATKNPIIKKIQDNVHHAISSGKKLYCCGFHHT